ncbi:MAG: L-fucose/L-arabinose isomerase family protein [Blautia sp.]
MRKLRIGFVPMFHGNARGDHETKKRILAELEAYRQGRDFDIVEASEIVYGYDSAARVSKEMKEKKLDFLFLCSFGATIGNCAIPFGTMDCPIGIWAMPECSAAGFLPMNAFCGSMILSGMLGKYFTEKNIKFKWFYGYTDNPLFRDRFEVTLKVLRAIAALEETRIAAIGPVVDGFDYMVVNEGTIEARYGAHIDRLHTVEEMIRRAEGVEAAKVKTEVEQILTEGVCTSHVSAQAMERFARLYLAFKEFAEENHYQVLSISCWRTLQEVYGMVPCGAVSRLNDYGIISSCEGDIDGAIGMIVDKAFNGGTPASMVDLVSVDEQDQSLNIWHCGPAPKCMADPKGILWDHHFNMGEYRDHKWCGCGVVADLQFKPGEITLNRISSNANEMTVFTGEIFDKETYQGSSGWVRNFKMQGEDLSIPELLSTIYNYRVDHHMSFGYGNNEEAFIEFANWKGIKVAKKSGYHNYMELRK